MIYGIAFAVGLIVGSGLVLGIQAIRKPKSKPYEVWVRKWVRRTLTGANYRANVEMWDRIMREDDKPEGLAESNLQYVMADVGKQL